MLLIKHYIFCIKLKKEIVRQTRMIGLITLELT